MKRSLWTITILLMFAQQVWPADVLQQVVIFSRHGVRSPTWEKNKLNEYSTSPWPDFGTRNAGDLTPHGRELMKLMGDFYRLYYTSSGLLGEPACGDLKFTYFWADTDRRTKDTAQALAEGMLPGCKADVQWFKGVGKDPLFHPVEAGVAKPDPALSLAAVQGRIGPELDALGEAYKSELFLLQRVLNGNGKPQKSIFDDPISLEAGKDDVTMKGPLAIAQTLSENFLLEYANGLEGQKFGWGRVNLTDLERMLVTHTAYAELMRSTPYLAQARASNLLSHIMRTMEQTVTGKPVKGAIGPPGVRLVLLSGHDTNISNLAGMLQLSWVLDNHRPDDTPPGGALIFSLWKSSDGKYSVRLQFFVQKLDQMHRSTPLTLQNPPVLANLFLTGCGTAQDGYPCSWSNFTKVANSVIIPAFVEQ